MKTLYALALALLLASPAQAQSHTNPVGEKAMEAEIRKNERWRTFYDSLTEDEKRQFTGWWRQQLQAREPYDPVATKDTTQYKRAYRQGLQQWYRDEVETFEKKREIQMRYDELWQQRQQQQANPVKAPPKKRTTIRVIDGPVSPADHNRGNPRYYRP